MSDANQRNRKSNDDSEGSEGSDGMLPPGGSNASDAPDASDAVSSAATVTPATPATPVTPVTAITATNTTNTTSTTSTSTTSTTSTTSASPPGMEQIHEDDGPPLPVGMMKFDDDELAKKVEKHAAKHAAKSVASAAALTSSASSTSTPASSATAVAASVASAASAARVVVPGLGVEYVEDGGPPLPDPLASFVPNEDAAKMKKKKNMGGNSDVSDVSGTSGVSVAGTVEVVDDDENGPPRPLSMQYEFHDGSNLKSTSAPVPSFSSSRQQTNASNNSYVSMNQTQPQQTSDTNDDDASQVHDTGQANTNQQITTGQIRHGISNTTNSESTSMIASLEHDASVTLIPEAFLVEPNEEPTIVAVHAEPVPTNWWKQKRYVFPLAFFAGLLVVILVVVSQGLDPNDPAQAEEAFPTLPVTTSSNGTFYPSLSPSNSNAPSIQMSSFPSSSLAPSDSPSACESKVLSQSQTINLAIPNPSYIDIAMDGPHAIVITGTSYSSPVYITFYFLGPNGWDRVTTITEENVHFQDLSLSHSPTQTTAIVGFQLPQDPYLPVCCYGVAYFYELDDAGLWRKVQEEGGYDYADFGWTVHVEDDLAAIGAMGELGCYIFRRGGDKSGGRWEQIEHFYSDWEVCHVGKRIVAHGLPPSIYSVDRDAGELSLLQDIEFDGWLRNFYFSDTYMVLSKSDGDSGETISIYRWSDSNGSFSLLQQLYPSDYGEGFGREFVLDMDTLFVLGDFQAFVFSEFNGRWEQSFTMDITGLGWSKVVLSGRHVWISTGMEVLSFNINDCTQDMPTHMPSESLSSKPSLFPSLSHFPSLTSVPSYEPSISVSPSTTAAPSVTCYWIEIEVEYWQAFSGEVSWDVTREYDTLSGTSTTPTSSPISLQGDMLLPQKFVSSSEKVCLEEGQYRFSIYNVGGAGVCCRWGDEGQYLVSYNEEIIAEGGEFGYSESTVFNIP